MVNLESYLCRFFKKTDVFIFCNIDKGTIILIPLIYTDLMWFAASQLCQLLQGIKAFSAVFFIGYFIFVNL